MLNISFHVAKEEEEEKKIKPVAFNNAIIYDNVSSAALQI